MSDVTERNPRAGNPEGIAPNTTTAIVAADEDRTQARCRRCAHVIVAPLSLETGYGKKCRRILAADLPEGVADDGDAL